MKYVLYCTNNFFQHKLISFDKYHLQAFLGEKITLYISAAKPFASKYFYSEIYRIILDVLWHSILYEDFLMRTMFDSSFTSYRFDHKSSEKTLYALNILKKFPNQNYCMSYWTFLFATLGKLMTTEGFVVRGHMSYIFCLLLVARYVLNCLLLGTS